MDAEGTIEGTSPATNAPGAAEGLAQAEYRSALRRLDPARTKRIADRLGVGGKADRPTAQLLAIESHWTEHGQDLGGAAEGLGPGPLNFLGLLALTESTAWPRASASLALELLGFEAAESLEALESLGLIVSATDEGGTTRVFAHPGVVAGRDLPGPRGEAPASIASAHQVREADGLEFILRLASLWQRLGDGPLRQTQQGTLYKRDRERLEEDPGLAGPLADALAPLPDLLPLLLGLARRVGLVALAPGGERLDPAPADYWAEHGVHLPHMLASAWLGLSSWDEARGAQESESAASWSLAMLRPVVLLWLGAMPPGHWVALEDLVEHLRGTSPGWSRLLVASLGPAAEPEPLLASLLLGPAYQLGLVRAAEEGGSGRRVAQLTELGRYVLGVGPHPQPRPDFPQFLFVQPNFQVIAYRQGLSPGVIGQLARFARWTNIGAALELELTAASVYRGLEGGLTAEAMLERLERHSARALPPSVIEAVRTWSARRDRVTFHASATLVEFISPEALEEALGDWPNHASGPPIRVAPRVLLVEDDRSIPFARFRLAASRDYRRPAEACVQVEADGLTLTLDPNLSDLLIDAELARFTEERDTSPRDEMRRRFVVSRSSLSRALDDGITPSVLARWFERRVGGPISPAMRLLLHASQPKAAALVASRPIVLTAPSADLLDGLWQHPDTRPYLDERLGPTSAVVMPGALEGLRRVLGRLGLALELGTELEGD